MVVYIVSFSLDGCIVLFTQVCRGEFFFYFLHLVWCKWKGVIMHF
uniref:Uncharacterized protein n=1 Tax=Rhizophora mucronata TaxID=61149 RepID=A0A2P2JZ14_RHIMU